MMETLIHNVISGPLTSLIVVIGCCLNLITIGVFWQSGPSIHYYLICTAFWDTIVLAPGAFLMYSFPNNLMLFSELTPYAGLYSYVLPYAYYMSNLGITSTLWVAASLCIDRYTAMQYSLRHKVWHTKQNVLGCLTAVSSLAVLTNLPLFFAYKVEAPDLSRNNCSNATVAAVEPKCWPHLSEATWTRSPLYSFWYRFICVTILHSVIPMCVLLGLTVTLSMVTIRTIRVRRTLSAAAQLHSSEPSANPSTGQQSARRGTMADVPRKTSVLNVPTTRRPSSFTKLQTPQSSSVKVKRDRKQQQNQARRFETSMDLQNGRARPILMKGDSLNIEKKQYQRNRGHLARQRQMAQMQSMPLISEANVEVKSRVTLRDRLQNPGSLLTSFCLSPINKQRSPVRSPVHHPTVKFSDGIQYPNASSTVGEVAAAAAGRNKRSTANSIGSGSVSSLDQRHSQLRQDRNAIRNNYMHITILLKFIICRTLSVMLDVMEQTQSARFHESIQTLRIVLTSNLLIVLNSATNFFVYVLFSQWFRNRISSFVSCVKHYLNGGCSKRRKQSSVHNLQSPINAEIPPVDRDSENLRTL